MPKIDKICKCGKRFSIYPYRENTALYCSLSCKSKYIFHKKGYKNPLGSIAKMGSKNPQFGKIKESVGLRALHQYVRKYKPCDGVCEHCGESKKLDLANKKPYRYLRDFDDWLWLCHKCHMHYDDTIQYLELGRRFWPHGRRSSTKSV